MGRPKWLNDLLPQDLKDVLNKKVKKPTTKGRKSAIDQDNVNDVAYYFTNKRYKSDPIREYLKDTSLTPDKYAKQNKKYKCYSYFLSLHNLSDPLDPLEAPLWYKCFYLYEMSLYSCNPEIIYELFYQVPFESTKNIIERLDNIKTKEKKTISGFSKRTKPNKEKDIIFYQQLKKENKLFLLKYIQKKIINFEVDDLVMNEGSYAEISSLLPVLKLANYSVANGKIEEFKVFIGKHRSLFKKFKNYQLIQPKYRGIYDIAFADEYVEWEFASEKRDDEWSKFYEMIMEISKNGLVIELQFLCEHGLFLDEDLVQSMISYYNKPIIDYIISKRKLAFEHSMNYFLNNREKTFFKLVEMGYHSTIKSISSLYQKKLRPYTQNFEIINTLPPNEPLDKLKCPIANNHPELIKPFIEKFGHRFENNDLRSWGLAVCNRSWDSYQKICDELNCDPSEFIPHIFEVAFNAIMVDIDVYSNKKIVLGCLRKYHPTVTKDQARFVIKSNDVRFATDLQDAGAGLDNFLKTF